MGQTLRLLVYCLPKTEKKIEKAFLFKKKKTQKGHLNVFKYIYNRYALK